MFNNSQCMVSSFKSPSGHPMPVEEQQFNMVLGGPHVMSKHTIGIVKAHFPFLQSISMLIMEQKICSPNFKVHRMLHHSAQPPHQC